MTRSSPRRSASSRTPVSRPRRVAGQAGAPPAVGETPVVEEVAQHTPVVEEVAQQPPRDPGTEAPDATDSSLSSPSPASPGFETGAERPPRPADDDPADERAAGLAALFESRRATVVLLAVVVVLALVSAGLFFWTARDDTDVTRPSSQPVVMDADDVTAGVEAAAQAAETIVTRNYAKYDDQVDDALALMTPTFAKEYEKTTDDIKAAFVKDQLDVQARVVAQGVVHATRTEVQALVFLNQYKSKAEGDTTYVPFRALVTVVHTDQGWLVSDLDTK